LRHKSESQLLPFNPAINWTSATAWIYENHRHFGAGQLSPMLGSRKQRQIVSKLELNNEESAGRAAGRGSDLRHALNIMVINIFNQGDFYESKSKI
jgi:hypothetical protein